MKGGYDLKHTPTILAEFEEYLKQNNLTLAQFAEFSGVHQRTLSNWITQHRPVSVQQLDRITLAMGLPEGYFYELYIENYIIDLPPELAANRATIISLWRAGQAGCDPSNGWTYYGQSVVFAQTI